MRTNMILATVFGALAVSGAVNAAPSFQVPDFSAVNVTLTGTDVNNPSSICGNGYDCTTIASSDYFKQIKVTPSGSTTNDALIVTIVTDGSTVSDGNGGTVAGFQDVSAVLMCNNTGTGSGTCTGSSNTSGIVGYQRILSGQGTEKFSSNTKLLSGWAVAGGGNGSSQITIDQDLSDTGSQQTNGDDFKTFFTYTGETNAAGAVVGKSIDLGQIVGLKDPTDTSAATDADVQSFALRQRAGTKVGAASGTINNADGAVMSWGDANQDGITDTIQAVWLGQSIVVQDAQSNNVSSYFGYIAYDNLEDANNPYSRFLLDNAGSAAGAWEWDATAGAVFGTAPTAADPCAGATCGQ